MISDILLLIVSILMLSFGAKYLVESASRIAETMGISELVIGLTVIAFGTSAPEFAVTVGAALKGYSNISVGNIVGSNIFNLGFILGSVAIVKSIQASRKLVYRDGLFMITITFLLLFFFHDYKLDRYEGIILVGLLIGYLIFLFIKKEQLEEEELTHKKASKLDYFILPLSIITIIAGGHFLVESATAIARAIGISEWVIGVTIVAAGTSAPEMATSIVAVLKGKHGISAGNLIGSDLFNILGVLGLAGILNPLDIDPLALNSLFMLSGMVILVFIFLRSGWQLSRFEGAILVMIGITRWIFDFMK